MLRDRAGYSKYRFRGESGYIIAPGFMGGHHDLVAVRHSASVPPWADRDMHFHRESEEYYFLFQGELRLLVDGSVFTVKPREVLMVKTRVPHAVVGGSGLIEHFVVRFPAAHDREAVGRESPTLPDASHEGWRKLVSDWGCRIPLTEDEYQNCWLFGTGHARFHSDRMCLAYLSFPTDESASADRHPHRLHLHQESWEYYTVVRGTRMLQVEDELVELNEGEMLEVPPGIRHVLQGTHTPFEGFTFRVPQLEDKIVF